MGREGACRLTASGNWPGDSLGCVHEHSGLAGVVGTPTSVLLPMTTPGSLPWWFWTPAEEGRRGFADAGAVALLRPPSHFGRRFDMNGERAPSS